MMDPSAFRADPLADETIERIVGQGDGDDPTHQARMLSRIGAASRLLAGWTDNASLVTWRAPKGTDPAIASALSDYLAQGRVLPPWADAALIDRAERLFMDYGPLSCTLLFCASLPECYVPRNLAAVLHIAGQLEAHTEHRIRETAAMIFPVMLRGGLTTGDGAGVAQVLKVRLIHATIRHLILRGPPRLATGVVAAQTRRANADDLHQALLDHGWDTSVRGLPVHQGELAYTLLTFSYVFLRGMRDLGLRLSAEDERAYLHVWNVVGHVLGIERALMSERMADAEAAFLAYRERAAHEPTDPDVRPGLGRALVGAMARSIRLPVLRHLPVPLLARLCGRETAQAIGADQSIGVLPRVLLSVLLAGARLADGVGRLFVSDFSLTRLLTRALGYHLLTRFLMAQTRPLALPDAVLNTLADTLAGWSEDPRHGALLNRLEDRLTVRGRWLASVRTATRMPS